MMSRSTLPAGLLNDFIISLPAPAGMVADIVMFGRTHETAFRRLVILLIAGLGLLA